MLLHFHREVKRDTCAAPNSERGKNLLDKVVRINKKKKKDKTKTEQPDTTKAVTRKNQY